MKQQEFNELIEKNESLLEKYNKTSDSLGWQKLFVFVLLGFSVYFLFAWEISWWLIIGAVGAFAFFIELCIRHYRLGKKIKYTKNIIAINKRHLARISGEWADFADIGAEFINNEHPYSGDLDIVGKKSLFQFLNTTHTWYGRKSFADALLSPKFSERDIRVRHDAIRELSLELELQNELEHHFSQIGLHKTDEKLAEELSNNEVFMKNETFSFFINFVAFFAGSFAVISFASHFSYAFAIVFLLIQVVLWLALMLKTKRYLSGIMDLPYKLEGYSNAIKVLKKKQFRSLKLEEIQEKLKGDNYSAESALKQLGAIVESARIKSNGGLWIIANILTLLDIRTSIAFSKWRAKYADSAEEWFLALGEFEALLAFSVLPNICNNTSLPIHGKGAIKAEKIGHPLIQNDTRVDNDVNIDDNIFIISGSNMSGKTTFMRTIGVNLVLALAGSFVCAKKMHFPTVQIITSMRIADDLNEGVSTFYAELKRIKSIITLSESNKNILFLIDEIFRGTNSVDRLEGAKTVLKKLYDTGASGIITTHDLELCQLADEKVRIENYSFSEHYHDGQINFDYILKAGKSSTTNAKHLMEMVGIVVR